MQQIRSSGLTAWWNESSDWWLKEFLESRGGLVAMKRGIAGGAIALMLVTALLMFTPAGPQHPVARTLDWAMLSAWLLWVAFRWLTQPWPTPARSLTIVACLDATLTVSIWLDSTPLIGLARTAAFLWPGIYLNLFHSARAQAAHVAWVALTTVSIAIALGRTDDTLGGWAAAVALTMLCLTVNVGILPVLELSSYRVRRAAADSLMDPLTGLSNRRGLEYRLNRLPAQASPESLCVFVVDLDHFKSINGRFGHPIGDSVLIQTSQRIQDTMGPQAVIARVGGEEFVAIDLLDRPSVRMLADRLRQAIATTEPAVTASIGVAVTAAHTLPRDSEINSVLACADASMYEAKRRGGNTVVIETCVRGAHADRRLDTFPRFDTAPRRTMPTDLEFVAAVSARLMHATANTATEACEHVLAEVVERFEISSGFLRHINHVLRTSTLIAQSPPRPGGAQPGPVAVIPFDAADPVITHCTSGTGSAVIQPDPANPAVSVAVAPVPLGETTIWVLGFSRSDGKCWTPEQLSVITAIAPLFGQVQRRIAAEKRLRKLADHDELTGLHNHRTLIAHLCDRLAAGRPGPVAVLCLDADRLKSVNGRFGHAVGDWYLQILALRLDRDLGDIAMVARLDGDRFAIVPNQPIPTLDVEALAQSIQARLRDRITFDTNAIVPAVSIGLALGVPGRDDGPALLRRADSAATTAKRAGGDRVEIATTSALLNSSRDDIELELRGGIDDDALQLRYLPEFDLQTGAVVAAEALVRWQHPIQGLLQPESFIGIAESSDLAVKLGRWVLRRACADLSRWRSHGIGHSVMLRINVSPTELAADGFADIVADTLREFAIDGHAVCLEITERAMVDDINATRTTLAQLKDVGAKIALDDFGTGYAVLSHLKSLPVDVLKIDTTFVKDLGANPDDLAIVRAIIGLADAFGLEVVAEGVETTAAALTLMKHGCHRAQGFLLSRPVDADAMETMLATGGSTLPGITDHAPLYTDTVLALRR